MNIADRPSLYGEIRRVLKPGGRFALFDVLDGGGGELLLPVPWATDAGFRIDVDEDPAGELLPAMQRMMSTPPSPSTLTTAVLIDDGETKGPTYLRNLSEGRTALALVVCTAI